MDTFTIDANTYAIVAAFGAEFTPGAVQIIDISDPDYPSPAKDSSDRWWYTNAC